MKRVFFLIVMIVVTFTITACDNSSLENEDDLNQVTTSNTPEVEEVYYVEEGEDIHIIKSGAQIKDMTVEGNLYIDESIGDGEYYLHNVKIKGDMHVNGSGQNSGHMISVQGTKLIISSKTNPRIVCDVDTSFDGVQIASDCIVETQGESLKKVTVNNAKTDKAINVIMKGEFPEVSIESTANVTLDGGITLMSVLHNAKMTEIDMVDSSKMYFFSTNGKSVKIHGGTIIEAWINAEYCSLPKDVNKIGSEVGVAEVNVGDVTYSIPKTQSSNSNDTDNEDNNTSVKSILLEGYPKVFSNGVVITISVAAYEKCNVYALVESQEVGSKGTTPVKVRDGISAGSGSKMPDGGEYIVIHKSTLVDTILNEYSINIDFNDYFKSPSNNGNGENPGPPPDAGDSGNCIFVVVEDSNGNLSEVFEFNK